LICIIHDSQAPLIILCKGRYINRIYYYYYLLRDEILSALIDHLKLIKGERKGDEATYQENGGLLLDGRLSLERFQEFVLKDFPLEALEPDADIKIETTGGLVCHFAGRLPLKGEILSHPAGVTFEGVDADPRKVKNLLVRFSSLMGKNLLMPQGFKF
jgi:magnesium and cobalt transporter